MSHQVAASLEFSKFRKLAAAEANAFPWRQFPNSTIVREFRMVADVGVDGLKDEEKLKQVYCLFVWFCHLGSISS